MILNLKIFLDILMFSRGPQDLPSSKQLLKIIIFLNIIIGLITVDPKISYMVNIFFAVIYILVTLVFIKICLDIKDKDTSSGIKYASRYIQVCSGTLGAHALIALFSSVMTLLLLSAESALLLTFLVISIYAWVVNGHIFKNAFDTNLTMGMAISLLHSISCVFVMMLFIQLFV